MSVRLAIVGGGAIAEAMHLPAASAVQDVRVEALVEPNLQRAIELQQRFGIPRVTDEIAKIADCVDAVLLSTPPHLHRELALRAFRLGLHVLCEKPMAGTSADCEAMIAAAAEARRVLGLAHVFRFHPSRQRLGQVIANEELGAIRSVAVEQGNPYSWAAATGFSMRRDLVPGGVLLDSGIHPLDTLFWWCGESDIVEYEDDSIGGLESNVRLSMRSPSGYPVALRLSRTCSLANRFLIETDEASIRLSAYSPSSYEVLRGDRAETVQVGDHPVVAADCAAAQLIDFVESIRGEHPPRITGSEGAALIRTIEACYERKRSRVLPETAPLPGLTW